MLAIVYMQADPIIVNKSTTSIHLIRFINMAHIHVENGFYRELHCSLLKLVLDVSCIIRILCCSIVVSDIQKIL
jgi:hypothetical protein